MAPAIRAGLLTILAGTVAGFLILGVGGRLGMHAIALSVAGHGSFTLGGTASVLAFGAIAGAAAGFLLFLARATLGRWPPLPSIVFWGAACAWIFARFDANEPLELVLILPLALAFGIVLQAASWRWRRH